MVAIHVKGEESEDQQFLYECSSSSSISETVDSISLISNLQSKIQTLATQSEPNCSRITSESCPKVALVLDRMLSEAESYASKGLVIYKRALSPHILGDHIRTIEEEVILLTLNGLINDDVLQVFSDNNGHEESELWWAGKELVKMRKQRYAPDQQSDPWLQKPESNTLIK